MRDEREREREREKERERKRSVCDVFPLPFLHHHQSIWISFEQREFG